MHLTQLTGMVQIAFAVERRVCDTQKRSTRDDEGEALHLETNARGEQGEIDRCKRAKI